MILVMQKKKEKMLQKKMKYDDKHELNYCQMLKKVY